MDIKTYPKYKDSGIEWLGEVPEHWDVKKLKYNASVRFSNVDKKTEDNEYSVKLCNYVDVYYNSIITSELEFMQATASIEEKKKFQLKLDDVLITKDSEDWRDIGVPAYISEEISDLLCGYHLALIRTNQKLMDGKYLFWLLSSKCINYQLEVEASGITRYGLSNYAISNAISVIPELKEQEKIAYFLDRETAKIDSLIAKKEKQIELLKEKRQALISHVVTKGLNSNVKMKDSGIEWLGEVPEHWEVKRLKYVSTVNNESLGENTDPDFEMLYVDISSVDSNEGIINKEPMVFSNAPSRARRKVENGDVIVSTVRTYLRAIAAISNAEDNLIVSTGFAVVHPIARLTSRYAAFALCAPYFVEAIVANSVGVSYPAINASEMMTFKIVIPSEDEQEKIAFYLDRETENINSLIDKISGSIDKLREYRTALISAAVTGKIDVRSKA